MKFWNIEEHFISEAVEHWLQNAVFVFSPHTRPFARSLQNVIQQLTFFLDSLPFFVILLLISGTSFLLLSRRVAIFSLIGLFLIYLVGLWSQAIETIVLVGVSSLLAIVLGLPTGILGAYFPRYYRYILAPLLDIMQAMPAFVYLIPAIPFFGTGSVSGVFATLVFAMPPVIRMTVLGIQQIPNEIYEASRSFGSSYLQTFIKVQFPLALPAIMSGINQTILMSISMVVIAAMIGAGGLGQEVNQAINRLEFGRGLLAGGAIVILAIILDRLTQTLASRYRYFGKNSRKSLKGAFVKDVMEKIQEIKDKPSL